GFGGIGTYVHGAVHRLHGGVSREGKFVGTVNLFSGRGDRSIGVAIIAIGLAGLRRMIEELFVQRFRRFARVRSVVPFDLQRFAALHGGPGIVGDDGNAAGRERALADRFDREDVAHAGHTLGLAGVKRLQLGAENGAAGYDGILHAGDTR